MEIMTMAQAIDALNSGDWMVYREEKRYVGIRRSKAVVVHNAIRNTLHKQGPLSEAVLYNRVGRAHVLTPMAFKNLLESTDNITLVTNKWMLSP